MTHSFTLITFNVRADRPFEHRLLSFLHATLRELNLPDILCLQEVPHDSIRIIEEHLKEHYEINSSGSDTRDGYGVLLASKKTSFELVGNPRVHELDSKMGRRLVTMLLKHKETGLIVGVGTAHLESMRENRAIRGEQLARCFAALEPSRPDSLVILGMDSNLDPAELPPIPEGYKDVGLHSGPTWFLNRLPGNKGTASARYDRILLSLPEKELDTVIVYEEVENLALRGAELVDGVAGAPFHLSDHNALFLRITILPRDLVPLYRSNAENRMSMEARKRTTEVPVPLDLATIKRERAEKEAEALRLAKAQTIAQIDAEFGSLRLGGDEAEYLDHRNHIMRLAHLEWNTRSQGGPFRWTSTDVDNWDGEAEFDPEVWMWYFYNFVLREPKSLDDVAEILEADTGLVESLCKQYVDSTFL